MAGSLNLGHVVGPAGQGVASGGTTGQYLKKASSTDYDTEWASFANATQSAAGMMSATDKTKLDGLPSTAATQSAMGLMSAADKTKLDGLPASAAVPGSVSIIVDGDTAEMAVPAGQYAYIKNNTHGLAEGLYKNKSSSAFPTSGGTADSTVFEAVNGGGLNALNSNITNLTNRYNIKKAPIYIPQSSLGSLSQTSVSIGNIATVTGVSGLTQDRVVSIVFSQTALTPASNALAGMYNDDIYIAATQSCTIGAGGLNGVVWYYE